MDTVDEILPFVVSEVDIKGDQYSNHSVQHDDDNVKCDGLPGSFSLPLTSKL